MEDVDPGCRILGPEVGGRTGCAQAFRYHPDGRGVFGDRLPSRRAPGGGGVRDRSPKSKAALRTVPPLPTGLRPIIRAHLDTFAQAGRSGLVFPSETGNVPPHENTVRPHYKRAAAKIGHPTLRFHDLRHSAATLFAQAGATLADHMTLMGHTSSAMSARYTHSTAARNRSLVEALWVDDEKPPPS